MSNAHSKLGISWPDLKIGRWVAYQGTPNGVKQSVSRANRHYAPKEYEWQRRGKRNDFYVRRTA